MSMDCNTMQTHNKNIKYQMRCYNSNKIYLKEIIYGK